jgi:hypothetical protein
MFTLNDSLSRVKVDSLLFGIAARKLKKNRFSLIYSDLGAVGASFGESWAVVWRVGVESGGGGVTGVGSSFFNLARSS